MSDFLYMVTTRIEEAYEEDFNRWQGDIHCPALMTLPGYWSVSRWHSLDQEHMYTNLWHIRDKAAFDNPRRKKLAMDPEGVRLDPFRHRSIKFFTRDGDGLSAPPEAENSKGCSGMLLARFSHRADLAYGISAFFRERVLPTPDRELFLGSALYHSFDQQERDDSIWIGYSRVPPSELETLDDRLDRFPEHITNAIVWQHWEAVKGI